MLRAVVLAGGASTRMGSPKALLRTPDGHSFVIRIVKTLLESGLGLVTVVTGTHHDVILAACQSDVVAGSIRCVRNPDPSRGQLSSLVVGLDAVEDAGTDGVLMTLVDVPLVAGSTVSALIDAWRRTRAPIVRPEVGGAHGHPVIFDRQTFREIRTLPLEAGARDLVHRYADRVENVEVADRGCLMDVDTPDEYARLKANP